MYAVIFVMTKLNIADWISIYRIAVFPGILAAVFFDAMELTGWLLLISFFTDALDGFIARKLKIRSERGANLDSVGDALTFLAGIAGFVFFGTDKLIEHFGIIAFALGLYLIQLFLAFIKYGRSTSFHTYSAKLAAVLQAAFLVLFHLVGWMEWLFWTGIAISILETVEEIILIFVLRKWQADVKGLYWVLRNNGK